MELSVKYGKKFETDRIAYTLNKLEWYKSHNYKPILPQIGKEGVNGAVDAEFNPAVYKKAEEELLKEYSKIKRTFSERIKKHFMTKSLPGIEVILTKYGVWGSYYPPNRVIINIQAKKPLIQLLKHEILHLFLEGEVIRKRLSQEEKEKLVSETERKFM